jgi:hypothetical protein
MNILYVIILIEILLIILFICIDYKLYCELYPPPNGRDDYKILKWCYLEDIFNEIDSGDLLLFSAYEFSKYTRFFGHLEFSHVGIVLKTNKLYSIEMIEDDYVYPGDPKYTGINHFDLIDRIVNYPGYVYIAKYNNTFTNIQYQKFKNIININFSYPSFFDNLTLLFNQNNILCNLENTKCKNKFQKIHCSNLIAIILFNLNIYNFQKIKPKDYHRTIVKLCNGDLFSEPVRIISKKNIISNIYDNKIKYYC